MAQDYFVVWLPKKRAYISHTGYITPILDEAKLYTSQYMAMCDAKDRVGTNVHGPDTYLIDRVGFRLINPL
jgi:hypothetical protein